MFVFIGISEVDFDKRTSTSGIVEDCSDDSLDIALSLDEVKVSISWGSHSLGFGSGVDATNFTFSLAPDNFTHKIDYLFIFYTNLIKKSLFSFYFNDFVLETIKTFL